MTPSKNINKINNSYETEESTGSGASLNENNVGNIETDELQLPFILSSRCFVDESSVAAAMCSDKLNHRVEEEIEETKMMSSQESFKGFDDSLVDPCKAYSNEYDMIYAVMGVAAKMYDSVVEENSCNAVDLELIRSTNFKRCTDIPLSNGPRPDVCPSKLNFDGHFKQIYQSSKDEAIEKNATATNFLESSLNSSLRSPDIFADDSDCEEENPNVSTDRTDNIVCNNNKLKEVFESHHSNNCEQKCDGHLFTDNCKREEQLLERVRRCLAGVPPPPSFTILQLDMFKTIMQKRDEILNFFSSIPVISSSSTKKSILAPTHPIDVAKEMKWKDILNVRQHGLCYNLSRASENLEHMSLAVVERFVGSETASSYQNSPSSAQKRNIRSKLLTQSPGNRLSHLARRRAVFSSANLASTSQRSVGPQVLLDKKKHKHRRKATPKRKTPGSKRKTRKTPSSSARKRFIRMEASKPGPTRETSKRALFQSPAKHKLEIIDHIVKVPAIKPEIATRVEKSKRALFSPENTNSNSSYMETKDKPSAFMNRVPKLDMLLKRKRTDAIEEESDDLSLSMHNSKMFCGSKTDLTPRSLKIKSESFCIGAGTSSVLVKSASSTTFSNCGGATSGTLLEGKCKMQRAFSDMGESSNSLTENQRKKLLWAVSQALQEKKIGTQHEKFRQFAMVLARVVKRIFQEFHQKSSRSNSETMLRLAKKFAYGVISGKTADDMYLQAKSQIEESMRSSSMRRCGYVGPEEFAKRQTMGVQKKAVFEVQKYNPNNFGTVSGEDSITTCLSLSNKKCHTQQKPIQANQSLQNSSSKSNLGELVLRENLDCELRRSANKNFTGKDQRNVSPFAKVSTSPAHHTHFGSDSKRQKQITMAFGSKAKRQISFDS